MLSVIIPVYNTEKYLRKCLESLASQTYKELEVILVDDGSTDSSGKICDEYAEKNKNFCVFHQENQGVVAARNRGVTIAKGEYVSFIDSDDWIESEFYETLMKHMEKECADIVTSGMIYEWNDRKRKVTDTISEGVYTDEAIVHNIWDKMMYDEQVYQQGITASLGNKIFNKEKIKEVMKSIGLEIKYCEDGAALYTLLTRINKLVVTHYCGYHYIQHDDSAIHTYTMNAFENIFALQRCMKRELLGGENGDVLERQIDQYVGPLLNLAIKSIYGINLKSPVYLFPFYKVPSESKIILYGAGQVGQCYYNCIKDERYVKLSAWVDKKYDVYQNFWQVENPNVITDKTYDYVVIAIEREDIAEEIQKELVKNGVCENKIIWEKPQRLR